MILGFAGIGFMTYRRSLKAVTDLINEISEDPFPLGGILLAT
jgi:hypothetical protein